MDKMIEDFSVKVPMTGHNGCKYTDCVDLKVLDWNDGLVAYTFNSDSENTAKQLYKALEKYKSLRFVTGVNGCTKNYIIQETIKRYVEKMYPGVKIEREPFDEYRYSL